MTTELTPAERAELERRIDCPVPWCEGRWLDHGGDGQPPELWLHDDGMGIDLGYSAVLARSQEGSGSVVWSFSMGQTSLAEAVDSPRELSQMLRVIAAAIDDAAARIAR